MTEKISFHPNISKMVKYVAEQGMLYSYVDPHADIYGGLSFTNPDQLFNVYLNDIDFRAITVDLNKANVTFLDVLKAIPFCKKVEFEICRPAEGVIETLIIE